MTGVSSSVLTVGMADEALERSLRERLAAVEAGWPTAVRSEHPFITEAAQHVMRAGGKRFRPMLVLLAAEFGEARPAR